MWRYPLEVAISLEVKSIVLYIRSPFKKREYESSHVRLVGLLKYSGQSDNTAAQKIYNKSNVHTN